MWDSIIYKLPKDVDLCQDLKERAIAYYKIKYYGQDYYIPITKEMKKVIGFHIVNGKIDIPMDIKFEDFIRDIIASLYLQVRDIVCAGIEQNLDQELKEGFSKLFENYIHKRVNEEVNLKLEHKNE